MKTDFKLLSGNWGFEPDDTFDIFRLQLSSPQT